MSAEQLLVCRIFGQAIADYIFLKQKDVKSKTEDGLTYSLRELERFFGSRRCSNLLDMIDTKLSGNDILSKIKSQCA